MALNSIYMLPDVSRNMSQMADLLQAEQQEICFIQELIKSTQKELLFNTCTDLITRYEDMFAIEYNDFLTSEERIKNIIIKFNARTNTTIQTIKDLVFIILGCEADVIEYYSEYCFLVDIYFTHENLTSEVYKVLTQINIIKPAHIAYGVKIKVDPIILQNINTFKFYKFKCKSRVNNYNFNNTILDGSNILNGSWLLNSQAKGINFYRFKLNTKCSLIYNNNINTINHCYLNGNFLLDGKYLLNTNILNN